MVKIWIFLVKHLKDFWRWVLAKNNVDKAWIVKFEGMFFEFFRTIKAICVIYLIKTL